MSSVNLYDVLNVQNDATLKEIKSAYRRLAKEYHPDRNKNNGNNDMFELITHAYTILADEKTRREYDEIYNLSNQADNDHFKLKSQSKQYHELATKKNPQSTQNNKNSKELDEMKELFRRETEEMNRKHNYSGETKPINQTDTERRINDLKMTREHDDIENGPDDIFNGKFDLDSFNATFDKYGASSSSMNPENSQLVESKYPQEYNAIGFCEYGNLSDYGKLYDETPNDDLVYAKVDFSSSTNNRIKRVDGRERQNKLKEFQSGDIDKRYEEQIMDRERLMKLGFDDYKKDGNIPYGVFTEDLSVSGQIEWDVEGMREKYTALKESRGS